MKKQLMSIAVCLLMAIGVIVITGCNESVKKSGIGEKTYYTKYNVHYFLKQGKQKRAAVQNYTLCEGHSFLPYNSVVQVGKWSKGFALVNPKSGDKIFVDCKYLLEKPVSAYLDLILSETPMDYSSLSDTDKKGISAGKPYVGMSKEGILAALGYPLPRDTKSLDSNAWRYWKGRTNSYMVRFNNNIVESTTY